MTIIDGDRLPGSIPGVPGRALDLLELMSVATGRSRGELVATFIVAAYDNFSTPVEAGAPPGVDSGPGAGTPSAPAIAHAYTDPDGYTLALVAQSHGPADWLLRLTTMAGDGELDLWVEDDETLAGIARGWLGAIEDRPR